jgi:hypothetical protein
LLSLEWEVNKTLDRNSDDFSKLNDRLNAVKSLDTTLVESGLKSAKATHPLPEDIKSNISKATWIAPDALDATISSGTNPQVNNLVDTYYLTYAEKTILNWLPKERRWDAERKFSDLRASARDYGVLASFQTKDLERNIADKSNQSQQLILSWAAAITWGRGDIPVVRQGEQLYFKSPDGKEVTHSMDISKIPPEVTRMRWAIRISYILPDTVNQAKQASLRNQLDGAKKESGNLTEGVQSTHKKVEVDIRKVDQAVISIDEFTSLVNSLSWPLTTVKKKENCDRLIELCSIAEISWAFDPKTELKWEELTTREWFRDYFIWQKIRTLELRKKIEEIGKLEWQIKPLTSEKSAEELEGNLRQNLEWLTNLTIDQFSTMNEVISFLISQNGPEIWNNWSDAESINKSLANEKIPESQWVKILSNLARIHDNIAGTNASELANNAKMSVITRPEWNGIPRIINSIRNYKITKNGGSELNRSQFSTLIQRAQAPQMNQKKA